MNDAPARLLHPTPGNLLARILEQPDLPAQIERLSPRVLGALVERIGLEDAGELLALATTEQIAEVFDEDLWKNERPGEAERFDAERFLVWLEIMLEAGDAFVANRLTELPEDLVTLAFHEHLLVFELDALAAEVQAAGEDEGRLLEKALEGCLYEELGEYQLMSRAHEGWDALLTAILALDRDHHECLAKLLSRCAAMTAEHVEESGGLYEVLTSEEMLESDVAGEREDRRAARGFVAPPAAAAFLALARAAPDTAHDAHDPVTRAYFRELGPSSSRPAARSHSPQAPAPRGLSRILAAEGMGGEASGGRLLAASPAGAPATDEPLLLRAMRRLAEDDAALFAERTEELAYLTNVLVAGLPFEKRRLRPIEALRAAIAACSRGLELSMEPRARASKDERALAALQRFPADGLFRRAWPEVHREPGGIEAFLERAVHAATVPEDVPREKAIPKMAPVKKRVSRSTPRK